MIQVLTESGQVFIRYLGTKYKLTGTMQNVDGVPGIMKMVNPLKRSYWVLREVLLGILYQTGSNSPH